MKKLDKLPKSMRLGQKLVGVDGFGCMNSGLATVLAKPSCLNGDYIVCADADYQDAKLYFLRNPQAKVYRSDIQSMKDRPAYRCSSYRWACQEFNRRNDKMLASRKADYLALQENLQKAKAGDMRAVLNLADF